ncbi:MotA/TolQ/ExbB proton channel family protein [Pseudorhodoferax sp. Leaf265]|uniref:MotA/TolQ/ExbB proton channel family protein n=1 Tax=Pseudorhodoferax sp. Leaf265 TaxID=1736315 RepID=UPI0006F85DD8|nr:MotA/TolQ/ExbB proton channel family protein [Pseudorhodoferax sp. Leaf265]KQP20830.1 flagellar motor protein MotA [Pseudorhodoferax sp. Leaf265]
MNALDLLTAGDAIHRLVAWLLLAMSVSSWVVILYKLWVLRRAGRDVLRGTAAFWQAPALEGAAERVAAFDRGGLLRPLLAATQAPAAGTLASSGPRGQQLTRLLRGALHKGTLRLQFGQVLLATVGSIAPFVGLLGTVWGIYHALTSISSTGQITISQVAGPVGEALVMTAAGLAVAIPAVLAYNWFGRSIARIEAELEGFAFDLRDLLAPQD